MADIEMPQLGETVTEGTITKWFKAVGDPVTVDEPLFEVSTDKVDSEVPAPASGFLAEILVPEGETVDVGTRLGVISDAAPSGGAPAAPAADAQASPPPPAEPPAAAAPPPPAEAPAAAAPPPSPEPAPAPAAAPTQTPSAPVRPAVAPVTPAASTPAALGSVDGRLLSPVVRRLVAERGLDPSTIVGTGPGGRITRNDVLAAAEAAPARPAAPAPSVPRAATAPASARPAAPAGERDTVEPFNRIRQRTAEHMVLSKQVSPHVLMTIEVDYEGVEQVRRAQRAAFEAEEGIKLTYLPFISVAVIDALREFPHANASVGDGALIVHHDINLGIAVDLDHAGLLVPVIRGADAIRLRGIAREVADLAARARQRKLTADEVTGGTFTISNAGPYGTMFTASIINQPEVAILSVDGIKRRPVVVEAADGSEAIAIHSTGILALGFDHRAFDGAYAAAFLARIKDIIESRDWAAELG